MQKKFCATEKFAGITHAAIRYFTWPYDMPLKTTAGTTVMASHCCQRAGLLVPSLEGLHLVGTEFKTTDCTSDVLHYGAVPLLPIETVAFEQCIHLSTDQGPEPPDYFPHHVAIKQAIARQGILPLVFDVAQIARRFWPPEALAEIQQLTQTNGSLSLATRNHLSIIKQQENDLSSLQQTVSTQEEMLRKEEGVNQESKTVIATQKETIAEQQKVISKHKETIATQEETIATQEGTIATQEEIMSEQIKTIAEQEQVIAEQKQKNALLLHTIEEKEQTSQREIEQLRAENAKLNHQLGKARRDDNNNNSGLSTGLGLFAVPPSTVADEAEDSSSEEETTVKKPSPQDGRES